MRLTIKEITIIKLHILSAAIFRLIDHLKQGTVGFLILFSGKAKASKLMKSGEIFEVQGETATAIEYFEKALHKYPKLFELHLNLCRCYLRGLSLNKAKEHGMHFMKKKPDSPEGLLYMGVVLYYENNPEAALDNLKNALDLMSVRGKKKASAHEYMGECYMKLLKYEDAAGCFEKAIKMYPGGSEKKYVSLGEAYYVLNKKEDALNAFKKALAVNPQSHEAWNNIGVIMWSVGNLENACRYFRKSIEIHPEYTEARTNLASVEESMKSVKSNGKKKVR
ncbi:MAG: tetratricopeptide repeat protein [Nitrospirae bacterium]|nr:tetratricopeptide repeat protein [Nitrospirota bacterium]